MPMTHPMAYGQWVCQQQYGGAYMQHPGMPSPMHQPNCMQPGMPGVSPYLMTVPTSPLHAEQTNQLLEELGVDQDARASLDMSPKSSLGLPLDPNEMACILSLPPNLSGSLHIPGLAAWPNDEEEYLARQHNHYLRKGLRTPSSLGSPPLSEPPTEAPSPRLIEADSNCSGYQGGDASSEDAREPTAAMKMVGINSPYQTEANTATIEAVYEPLALANILLEAAPVPKSPCRVFPVA